MSDTSAAADSPVGSINRDNKDESFLILVASCIHLGYGERNQNSGE
jgi:hypothetical protein